MTPIEFRYWDIKSERKPNRQARHFQRLAEKYARQGRKHVAKRYARKAAVCREAARRDFTRRFLREVKKAELRLIGCLSPIMRAMRAGAAVLGKFAQDGSSVSWLTVWDEWAQHVRARTPQAEQAAIKSELEEILSDN